MGWEGVKGGIKKDRDWSALCFYQSLALIVSLLLTTIFDPGRLGLGRQLSYPLLEGLSGRFL